MAFAYEKAQQFLLFYRFHRRRLSPEDWGELYFRVESYMLRFIASEDYSVCVLHQSQTGRQGPGLVPMILVSLVNEVGLGFGTPLPTYQETVWGR